MRKLGIILLLAAVIGPAAVGWAQNAKDEQEIKDRIHRVGRALVAADVEYLNRAWADEWTGCTSQGVLVTKTEELERLRSGRQKDSGLRPAPPTQ